MIQKTLFQFKDALIKAIFETVQMMSVAMLFSLIFGLIFGFMLFVFRKNGTYEKALLYMILSSLINLVRSVPFILFIIVMIPFNRKIIGTGFGVYASMIPLSIMGIATFSRFVEQDLLDVNPSIHETAYALGANKLQYFKEFLLVEARSSLVLSFTSTSISLLSYSTVMGIIGGGGLGYLAMAEGYHNFNYPLMWLIIVLMILLVHLIQSVGNLVSRKIDHR